MNEKDKRKNIEEVANYFKNKCSNKLKNRLASFYFVGSYAFGKISLDRPDINFLFIFKGKIEPKDLLKLGEICRDTIKKFKDKLSVRVEFRPFRYIYPKFKKEYNVFLNPITISEVDIKTTGVIFQKWFTEGLKSANKLIIGEDILSKIETSPITHEDLLKGAMMDLLFFKLPLERAPTQYDEDEYELLFNEALSNAKNIAYTGVEVAMSDEELKNKKYIELIQNKEKMVEFYNERYGKELAKKVEIILNSRLSFLTHKNDKKKAEEIFSIALELVDAVMFKLFSRGK
jgi:predicted nucleotidyltransferase